MQSSEPSVSDINFPPPGVLDIVFNGMPDWVYEEEIFASNKAFWMPSSGDKLCFAKFNDSKVIVCCVSKELQMHCAVDFDFDGGGARSKFLQGPNIAASSVARRKE